MKYLRFDNVIWICVGIIFGIDLISGDFPAALHILIFFGFLYVNIYIHEFGHAIAGIAAGLSVDQIKIGSGKDIIRKNIGSIALVITNNIDGGITRFKNIPSKALKLRYFAFTLGGVGAQGLAVLITMQFYDINVYNPLGKDTHTTIAHAFVMSNLFLIFINLLPIKFSQNGIPLASDGLRLVLLPFSKSLDIQQIMAQEKYIEGLELLSARKYVEAENAFRDCIDQYPESLGPKIGLGVALQNQIKLDEAKTLLESLVDTYHQNPSSCIIFNNLAWLYLITGSEANLKQADILSHRAIERNSKVPAIVSTRGCVLVERGAIDEGLALLNKNTNIRKPLNEKNNHPINIVYIAYGYYLKGELERVQQYVRKIEESDLVLDPSDNLIVERILQRTNYFSQSVQIGVDGIYVPLEYETKTHTGFSLGYYLKPVIVFTITIPILLVISGFWAFIIWAQIDNMPVFEAFIVVTFHMFSDKVYILPVLFGATFLLTLLFSGVHANMRRGQRLGAVTVTQTCKSHDRSSWVSWNRWYAVLVVGFTSLVIFPNIASSPPHIVTDGPLEMGWHESSKRNIYTDMAVDASGAVYLAGLRNDSDYQTVLGVTKCSDDGACEWSKGFNIGYYWLTYVPSIALDDNGNIYVTSSFDTFKCDDKGNMIWCADYSGSELALDQEENLYVLSNRGLMKLNNSGTQVWYKRSTALYPTIGYPDSWSLYVDLQGNAYASGPNLSYEIRDRYAVVKYNPLGDQQWSVTYDGIGTEIPIFRDMTIDDAGCAYVTGFTISSGSSVYHERLFTSKYDINGAMVWTSQVDAGTQGALSTIAVNKRGEVAVAGCLQSNKGIAIKYNEDGQESWVATIDGCDCRNADDLNNEVLLDIEGNVYVTYHLYDGESSGAAFIHKYDPSGNEVWSFSQRSGSNHESWGISFDALPMNIDIGPNGAIYLVTKAIKQGPGWAYSEGTHLVKYHNPEEELRQ